MKKIRLLSAFLTVVMVLGLLTAALPVYAGDTAAEVEEPATEEPATEEPATEEPATEEPTIKKIVPGLDEETGLPTIDYVYQFYASPEEKLASMTKYLEKGNYELYVEPVSGEIAYRNKVTGQILFSNPYDVSQANASDTIKEELLSQIIIKYTDNDAEIEVNSFKEACARGQIKVKKIKNGVRVEYAMGRMETRKLLPIQIKRERFEELIKANFPEDTRAMRQLEAYYELKDPFDPTLTERGKRELEASFPICREMAIYVWDPTAAEREKDQMEAYIKTYCPEYTFETLEEDHTITNYVGSDKAPVLFRLSLEYTLDEDGNLDVRLPANGIRFDESAFQLTYISMLPYFGAGSSDFNGYTFIPDGSGTLIRFEDVGSQPLTLTGKLYGEDYAYQEVGSQHRETMRLPVYGVYESSTPMVTVNPTTGEKTTTYIPKLDAEGNEIPKRENAFVAIIEEGDALAHISTEHGGSVHEYNTVFTTFYPRPKDTYNLAEAISVGQNATYTVVSDRKYTGSYRIKYVMLGEKNAYEASYVGMAKAYREYLIKQGILTEFTEVNDSIPLYIESFGCIQTVERILSMPIEVLKPLTTFDDLKEMYTKLSEAGITNINYKLTGFANGGMNDVAPTKVDFEKVVGDDKGFTDFVSYANSNGIGVYPDFDFANVGSFKMFDGISMGDHLVKTMDDRYTTKRHYDSTLQSFSRGFALAVSPSVYDYLFDKFSASFSALSPNGVSVATLGTDLNSDFDEDEPYNREDNKGFTTELLANLNETYQNVMTEGGNAYVFPYADHILGVSVDSSRFSRASEAIPFVGMVLHGCVNFTGTPINMAGDTHYEVLKAIENGSAMYFTLSMQNTQLLKEDVEFQRYYSVSYDIWYEDMIEIYKTLNEALAGLQNKQIIDHKFLIGERVPTAEELEADKAAAEELAKAEAEAEKLAKEKAELAEKLGKRLAELKGEEYNPIVFVPEEVPVVEVEEGYEYTKYTSDDGRIIKVTYEGGTSFILNYNNFEITVNDGGKTHTVGALGFVKVK